MVVASALDGGFNRMMSLSKKLSGSEYYGIGWYEGSGQLSAISRISRFSVPRALSLVLAEN